MGAPNPPVRPNPTAAIQQYANGAFASVASQAQRSATIQQIAPALQNAPVRPGQSAPVQQNPPAQVGQLDSQMAAMLMQIQQLQGELQRSDSVGSRNRAMETA